MIIFYKKVRDDQILDPPLARSHFQGPEGDSYHTTVDLYIVNIKSVDKNGRHLFDLMDYQSLRFITL